MLFRSVQRLPLLAHGRGVGSREVVEIEVQGRDVCPGNKHVQHTFNHQQWGAVPRHPQNAQDEEEEASNCLKMQTEIGSCVEVRRVRRGSVLDL